MQKTDFRATNKEAYLPGRGNSLSQFIKRGFSDGPLSVSITESANSILSGKPNSASAHSVLQNREKLKFISDTLKDSWPKKDGFEVNFKALLKLPEAVEGLRNELSSGAYTESYRKTLIDSIEVLYVALYLKEANSYIFSKASLDAKELVVELYSNRGILKAMKNSESVQVRADASNSLSRLDVLVSRA